MAEKQSSPLKKDEKIVLVFTKKNYQLLLISIAIVALGFVLMIGTGGDIYDTRRTLLAPIVVLFGFGFGIYAILKK
jgi:peptidoglycan/LPS O-acetylase OafA/YrhL